MHIVTPQICSVALFSCVTSILKKKPHFIIPTHTEKNNACRTPSIDTLEAIALEMLKSASHYRSWIKCSYMKLPSDPIIKWWISGPVDMRGTWQFFSTIPLGVTIFIWITCLNNKQWLHILALSIDLFVWHLFSARCMLCLMQFSSADFIHSVGSPKNFWDNPRTVTKNCC